VTVPLFGETQRSIESLELDGVHISDPTTYIDVMDKYLPGQPKTWSIMLSAIRLPGRPTIGLPLHFSQRLHPRTPGERGIMTKRAALWEEKEQDHNGRSKGTLLLSTCDPTPLQQMRSVATPQEETWSLRHKLFDPLYCTDEH